MFMREVDKYEAKYSVEVNVVGFVGEDILDAISNSVETLDIPSQPRQWTPLQLKLAMIRYFRNFKYTPKTLCEVAERVTPYPKCQHASDATQARIAIEQCAQFPIYCARLARFHNFVKEYRLLDRDWPTENNKDWGQHRSSVVPDAKHNMDITLPGIIAHTIHHKYPKSMVQTRQHKH
jgi:hypothetical protein